MDPHSVKSTSIIVLLRSIIANRHLIYQMTKREITGRYRGSFMGVLWSFINPVLMLTVYTFVFSVVFKARWGTGSVSESKSDFAIILFVGLIVHTLFAETLMRAPTLILGNVNYVKKVIFPLETLSVTSIASVLFHSIISLIVLLSAFFIFNGFIHWTVIFIPLVFFPLIIVSVGLSWFLSSLGVFIRDVGQTIAILTMILMFLSPIFYPVSALPEKFQHVIILNPLTFIIEQSRNVIIWGKMPDFTGLALYSIAALCLMWLCFFWFQKTRKGFADVL
ncbi:ABC transporter permease [Pantoea sp. Acro-805]|jgi:lipopolysaccharide transport system permease protein|uniref:Transport permease protein n=2 Tax=Candidatus Pantoea formicae TaxID=2608355 RepID=A0ABX0R304_9GAMM|nr:ABC transporter permease [Pantoea formicae]MDF7648769.1 ABC transporter permease [Erwiniaceae bacterium L1_54_3]NIF03605.1 ABC transporter permease [Pantoea formicae]